MDGTIGVACLEGDIDQARDGGRTHVWRVDSSGVGYALSMTATILTEPFVLGVAVQYRASGVGNIIDGGENDAGWRSNMFGGALEARY